MSCNLRKMLALNDIKSAVLNVAFDIESGDLKNEELVEKLLNVCDLIDEESQVVKSEFGDK